MQHKDTPSIVFKALVSATIAPMLLTAMFVATRYDKTFAQSPSPSPAFSLPSSLPSGTTVRLDGSSSMTATNNDLKQRFEEKFPGSVISLSSNGTDAALQALQKGEIDLAVIGRLLTDAEKAQGLVEAPMTREKIAIIVSPANPFKGSITDEQFVKIFRGEIKNWSELGGPDVAIRVIDRPASSDTRQALSRYPGFNSGPMQPGANATQLAQDDTAAVIRELGSDGIGYAIASQAVNQPDVAVLPMDDILPTDPRYPYSQSRNYVYRGQPNPGTIAFLGLTASTLGQEAVPPASPQEATAVQASPAAPAPPAAPEATNPAPAVSPTTAPTPAPESGFDWSSLWWLLIPLLGLPLLLWWMKGRGAAAPAAIAETQSGRMILVARNCRETYAYWEVPSEAFEEARRQGGRDLKVRLHDVTDVPDLDWQASRQVQDFPCSENAQDLHIPVGMDDRTYAAELGYVTDTGEWLRVAHSDPVHVPACTPGGAGLRTAATVAAGGVVAAGAAAAARASQPEIPPVPPPLTEPRRSEPKRIVMVPRSNQDAYVYWDVPEADKAALRAQGGRKLMLRVHDVTGRDLEQQAAHSVRQYECDEIAWDKHIPLDVTDLAGSNVTGRDYVAELGYVTDDNRWLSLVRSEPVHIPVPVKPEETDKATDPLDAAARLSATSFVPNAGSATDRVGGVMDNASSAVGDATRSVTNRLGDIPSVPSDAVKAVGATLVGGAAAVAGASPAMKAFLDRSQVPGRTDVTQQALDCRIVLVPLNAKQAYAYWEVAEVYKQALRDRGGRKLTLRIHDATNLDIDYNPPHSTQSYTCSETDQDKHVSIPAADRDYIADLGYFTDDNRWLRLIRSVHIHVPADQSM